jgi:hypothetical protein
MAALGQSRQVFEILSKSLGFVPVVGENLKSAAELASKICEEIEVCEGLPIILDPLFHDLHVIQIIQENREGYGRLGAQVRELLLAISGVVDQEKLHEGKLTARKPHVENLKRCVYEQFEKTILLLRRWDTQGAWRDSDYHSRACSF